PDSSRPHEQLGRSRFLPVLAGALLRLLRGKRLRSARPRAPLLQGRARVVHSLRPGDRHFPSVCARRHDPRSRVLFRPKGAYKPGHRLSGAGPIPPRLRHYDSRSGQARAPARALAPLDPEAHVVASRKALLTTPAIDKSSGRHRTLALGTID